MPSTSPLFPSHTSTMAPQGPPPARASPQQELAMMQTKMLKQQDNKVKPNHCLGWSVKAGWMEKQSEAVCVCECVCERVCVIRRVIPQHMEGGLIINNSCSTCPKGISLSLYLSLPLSLALPLSLSLSLPLSLHLPIYSPPSQSFSSVSEEIFPSDVEMVNTAKRFPMAS